MTRWEDPAFVTLSSHGGHQKSSNYHLPLTVPTGDLLARPSCQGCLEKSIAISTISQQLTEANARIAELQAQLQQSQQKLLVCLAAKSLQLEQPDDSSQTSLADSLLEQHVEQRLEESLHVDGPIVGEFDEPIRVDARLGTAGAVRDVPALPDVTNIPQSYVVPNLSCNVNVPELIRHAERGELSSVLERLDHGEDPNSTDDMGLTALHGAAKKGRSGVVQLLLQRRANPNVGAAAWRGETPLHYASKYGHTEIVQLLLESRAKADVVSQENRTPLQYATEKKHAKIQEALLAAMAAEKMAS